MSIINLNSITHSNILDTGINLYYIAALIHSNSGHSEPRYITNPDDLEVYYGDFEYKKSLIDLINNGIPVIAQPLLVPGFETERASLRISNLKTNKNLQYLIREYKDVSEVILEHNLEYYPKITCILFNGVVVTPQIKYLDINTVLIKFDKVFNGYVSIDAYKKECQFKIFELDAGDFMEYTLPFDHYELIALSDGNYIEMDIEYLSQYYINILNATINKVEVFITYDDDSSLIKKSINSSIELSHFIEGYPVLRIIQDGMDITKEIDIQYLENQIRIESNLIYNAEVVYRELADDSKYLIPQLDRILLTHPSEYLSHVDIYDGVEVVSHLKYEIPPTSTFILNHYLGYYPELKVVDEDNNPVFCSIKYLNKNSIELKFSTPSNYTVYINNFSSIIQRYLGELIKNNSLVVPMVNEYFEVIVLDKEGYLCHPKIKKIAGELNISIESTGIYKVYLINTTNADTEYIFIEGEGFINHNLGFIPNYVVIESEDESICKEINTDLNQTKLLASNQLGLDVYYLRDIESIESSEILKKYSYNKTFNYILDIDLNKDILPESDKFWLILSLGSVTGIRLSYIIAYDEEYVQDNINNLEYIESDLSYGYDYSIEGLSNLKTRIQELIVLEGIDKYNHVYDLSDLVMKLLDKLIESYLIDYSYDASPVGVSEYFNYTLEVANHYDLRLISTSDFIVKYLRPSINELLDRYNSEENYPDFITINSDLHTKLLSKISDDSDPMTQCKLLITTCNPIEHKIFMSLVPGVEYRKEILQLNSSFNYDQDLLTHLTESHKLMDIYSKFYGESGKSTNVRVTPSNSGVHISIKSHNKSETIEYLNIDSPRSKIHSELVDIKLYDYIDPEKGRYDQHEYFEKFDPETFDATKVKYIELPEIDSNLDRGFHRLNFEDVSLSDIVKSLTMISDYEFYPDLVLLNRLYSSEDYSIQQLIQSLKLVIQDMKSQYLIKLNKDLISELNPITFNKLFINSDSRFLLFYDEITLDEVPYPMYFPYCMNFIKDDYLSYINIPIIAPLISNDSETRKLRSKLDDLNINYLKYDEREYFYESIKEFKDSNYILKYILLRIQREFYRSKSLFISKSIDGVEDAIQIIQNNLKNGLSSLQSINLDHTRTNDGLNIIGEFTLTKMSNKNYFINFIISN